MTDLLQQSLHLAAVRSPVLGAVAVAGATGLLAALAAGLAALFVQMRSHLTWLLAARIAASGAAALLVTQLLGHVVSDPRPYLVEHYAPLARASLDNGFPSDHTLVAALITGWVGWLARRWAPLFAAGVLAVALGRLAIGAHHSLDVVGSVLIAGLSLWAASVWPWPPLWRSRALLPPRLRA
ncbi:phosphatase PAP2 family protein [Deinococcus koreensis]|uniref:Phosphatidic acid phosphatase type 2/haloperoxidase domain-containing protein n=1 Tax=Deinococcus koreensis TaxID=2054903 RepID=A0A2K3V1N5_9DEIO|nr:phosphatase PAP2 family protein [Deinococcus koreensis]PNY82700.1 hypothetical protein CVO96_16270 [Deinococcus koreensis]